jgi:acetyl esterase/lipase
MPRIRLSYGPQRSQVGDLWLPPQPEAAVPVVVLVHGGFWHARYTKPLMARLAKSVIEHRWAAWNIEYRRIGLLGGGGGWPATCLDVAAGIDRLSTCTGLDLDRVVACGHSAGGQLAFWAAARDRLQADSPGQPVAVGLRGAVSLAGVLDLVEADRLELGGGSTAAFLGGHSAEVPDVYAIASPSELLPLGVPQVVIHGMVDTAVPPEMSASYSERAVAAGDSVTHVALEGVGHRDIIDPRGPAWSRAVEEIGKWFEISTTR